MNNSKLKFQMFRAICSLKEMTSEMNRKNLEIKRITKTCCALMASGMSKVCVPAIILERCLQMQNADGGWVSVADTVWNTCFLMQVDAIAYSDRVAAAEVYLNENTNGEGLWGRSSRDMSRIPVTGLLLHLLPSLATPKRLQMLEQLWMSEIYSLTYKAAYTLMAFSKSEYVPVNLSIIDDTIRWLVENQRIDGGFAPWKEHPVASDVFCTSVAVLGLLQYRNRVPIAVLSRSKEWLLANQLPSGIWAYHEIEDGASFGLWALSELSKIPELQ